jgi:hypothetical protein
MDDTGPPANEDLGAIVARDAPANKELRINVFRFMKKPIYT